MELRLAKTEDLPQLKTMFHSIVKNMLRNGLKIWNDSYPYEEFPYEIEDRCLYLITKEDKILATFCLHDSTDGQDCFDWKEKSAKALYLSCLGINVDNLRAGLGSLTLNYAIKIAQEKNAEYLRLLVVEENIPAKNLYLKNGFTKVEGVYSEFSESNNRVMKEYGFEIKL